MPTRRRLNTPSSEPGEGGERRWPTPAITAAAKSDIAATSRQHDGVMGRTVTAAVGSVKAEVNGRRGEVDIGVRGSAPPGRGEGCSPYGFLSFDASSTVTS